MLNKSGWKGLGGASKKETTREALLQQAQADRAARSEARARSKAATTIQSHWRSHAARSLLRQQLLQQWHASYAGAAAQPDVQLPGDELRRGAVRLLLAALLPFASNRSRKMLATGEPYTLSSSTGSSSSSSSAAGALGSSSSAMAVRGTLALLLRSVGSSDPALNYTAACTGPDAQPSLQQASRVCQLCCLVLAAGPGASSDPVVDAAAARLLQLLTCADAWCKHDKTSSSSGSASGSRAEGPVQSSDGSQGQPAADAAVAVLSSLCQQPLPLLQAARRLVQCSSSAVQAAAESSAGPAGGLLQARMVSTAALQRVLGLCLQLLESPSSRPDAQQQHFVEQFVLLVVAAPGMTAAAPAAVQARLLQPAVMQQQLLPAATQLAASGRLSGVAALHCLANIAQLLIGCSQRQHQQQQLLTAPSPHLEDSNTAVAYCRAAVQLLSAGTQLRHSKSNGNCSRQRGNSSSNSAGKDRQQAQHRQNSNSSSSSVATEAAGILQDGCWMLGSQQHLLQLLRVLSSGSQEGMVLWAGYCLHLLQDSARISTAAAAAATSGNAAADSSQAAGGSGQLSTAVLNVVAFAPGVLPGVWRWLAVTAGLPLEAPLQASRGLDIAAVARGPEGLQQPVSMVLGLFCRGLAQLLQVLDDTDLHQRQEPFTLGTSRAIASTLNSLVFHTAFPEQQQRRQQQQQQLSTVLLLPATTAHGLGLLTQYAPVVLRGYYERDSRQQFCQPNLWTEPYSNMMASLEASQQQQAGGMLATTAAVVQALLAGVGLAAEEDEENGNSSTRPTSPAAAAAGVVSVGASSIPGLRTGALLLLLRSAPQCVPFAVRLELFRQMLQQDKVRGRWQLSPAEGGPRPLKVTVRRAQLLEDAFRGLAAAGANIKARLQVHFVNAQGVAEAGIDHGGLMKELLEATVAAGCQPEYGLFAAAEGSNLMYPNPAAEAIPQGLALLEFIGLMVGKALYEGILLNMSFAPCFLLSLQGGRPGLDDLAALDRQLHSNLLAVKACPPEDVEALGLTFSVEQQLFGRTVQTDLLPGGDSVAVTGDNRLLYVHLLADHLLNTRLGRATAAFAGGLSVVLAPSWLRMFSPSEINQLISGGQGGGVDVEDMARYVQYSNGYSESSHTIRMFWRVVAEMSQEQRSALLRFITSTSRAPLGGFKHLQPPLTIHKVDCGASPLAFLGGKDVDRLPSASTCYNMLKLPNYKRAATLKEKLLYAIGAGAGFELS